MDLLQTVRKEGSRGGRGEFKWDDVKNDAHRENYLGHSLMAPVGRWQKNKDLSWYAKTDTDGKQLSEEDIRKEEIRKIREAESDALARALGYDVPPRPSNNANLTALGDNKRIQHPHGDEEDSKEFERNSARRHSRNDLTHQVSTASVESFPTTKPSNRPLREEKKKRYTRREDRDKHHEGHKPSRKDEDRDGRERHRHLRDDSRHRKARKYSRSRSSSRDRYRNGERRRLHSKERGSSHMHRYGNGKERSRYSRSRSPDRNVYDSRKDRWRR